MSLILDLERLQHDCARMEHKARTQQFIYHRLIVGAVRLHQEQRIAKNFAVSDALRDLLKSVGVSVTQGTAQYGAYEKIPIALRGQEVNDTWQLDLEQAQRLAAGK